MTSCPAPTAGAAVGAAAGAIALALVLATLPARDARAQAAATTPTAPTERSPLLLMAVQLQLQGPPAAAGWLEWLFAPPRPPGAALQPPAGPFAEPPSPEWRALAVRTAIEQPLLGLKAQRLAGTARPLLSTRPGRPAQMRVVSGDVFALQFVSTTPGLLRLASVDARRTEVLDTYVLPPGGLLRLPREGAGGIEVDDQPGRETLRLEFEPCLPEALAGQPALLPFQGRLPRCSLLLTATAPAPAAARGVALALPAAGAIAEGGVLGPPPGYRPGQLLVHEIEIQHDPRP